MGNRMLARFSANVNFFSNGLPPHVPSRRFLLVASLNLCYKGQGISGRAGLTPIAEESIMKVIKPSEVPQESADSPLFTGGPVTRQPLVTSDMGNDFNINIVNFGAGARNKMHIHTSDQVLFVTAGKGIIATEITQEVITTGDVVHVSAGEKHWHGATPDSAFSHIALTAKGSRTTQVEE
jgi:quercetin dioxygenase-like cupin family protein